MLTVFPLFMIHSSLHFINLKSTTGLFQAIAIAILAARNIKYIRVAVDSGTPVMGLLSSTVLRLITLVTVMNINYIGA